ncbi:hypothetical protein TH5N_16230 [Tetragenococcus halophilus]|uniref:Transposase n=1 Tax=Tetragenococcus halophilus (strain DSM 20338 / JCM 20259 / NCIMB 9735 / NBRC 12172) TaxID=945021 RepID=A0AAN1SEG6_TETHN|nr:putative transposase [Tetragenococcus halophilus NBRC 12172]GEQ38445.1 hypothetical protein TH3N_15710 [Tetragenococcus halophilus]GEQ40745.1 hypothetical protein TH5N_16230 [Tetragenococcus halophilus]GEQ42948.1 hypothetical protein TH6N_15740 [Tetragenococcus halophilus]GEQ45236.1 hypothetical protein TH8N_16060 [Tetragenococcus halophilus]
MATYLSPKKKPRYFSLDKIYETQAIYIVLHSFKLVPITGLKSKVKNVEEIGEHYVPTCLLEYSYKYDSYDFQYDSLKFVRSKRTVKIVRYNERARTK